MEKISLLLLIVKKTLIGSVIAGILGISNFSLSINDSNEKIKTIEKSTKGIPNRDDPGRR